MLETAGILQRGFHGVSILAPAAVRRFVEVG
jgi:hypothetical protein